MQYFFVIFELILSKIEFIYYSLVNKLLNASHIKDLRNSNKRNKN